MREHLIRLDFRECNFNKKYYTYVYTVKLIERHLGRNLTRS